MSVAIVVLAAGMSSRTSQNGSHKLLALFDGLPLLRKVAGQAVASRASSVVVVLGHRQAEMRAVLSGLDVHNVVNENYQAGMSTSLALGFSAQAALHADGVMVMLADMPGITSEHIDRLIGTFEDAGGDVIVRATADGRAGNPVILPRSMAGDIGMLRGDIGAKQLIKNSELPVIEVEIGQASLNDVDTSEDVAAAGGVLDTSRREV